MEEHGSQHSVLVSPNNCVEWDVFYATLQKRPSRKVLVVISYDEFLDTLRQSGWAAPNRSFACDTLPEWLKSLSKRVLLDHIASVGESGYMEKMWLEDLADG